MPKKMRKRKYVKKPTDRFEWNEDNTAMLLRLWRENAPLMGRGKTNVQVHREIAEEMSEYQPTNIEVKAKMDNLIKRYKREIAKKLKYRDYKEFQKSEWIYFDEVEAILNECKAGLVISNPEDFDFSPLDDSDSDEKSLCKKSKRESIESDENVKLEFEDEHQDSILSDSACSTYSEPPQTSPETQMNQAIQNNPQLGTDRYFAIEEAKLAIQREKLKLMKQMADDLSCVRRELLNVFRNK